MTTSSHVALWSPALKAAVASCVLGAAGTLCTGVEVFTDAPWILQVPLAAVSTFSILPLTIALLVTVMLVASAPVWTWMRSTRRWLGRWLVVCFVYALAGIGFAVLQQSIYMAGFKALAERSQVLTTAIHAYEDANGRPPHHLGELVPTYLEQVPGTGMCGAPEYKYLAGPAARRYDGNRWVLIVQPPFRGIGWDQFLYFADENYPTLGYGGHVERVGDWAYVHE